MKQKNLEKMLREEERLEQMYLYERGALLEGYKYVAGTDEAGRGPIAGPVVAAAVILKPGTFIEGLNDSKKISQKKRERIYEEILSLSLSYSIKVVDNQEIDRINILQASWLAMKLAVEDMDIQADFVLVDGYANKLIKRSQRGLIKGDSLSASIAAASVLAKVYRDRIMEEYDFLYPGYGFASHKGYPTKKHLEALKELGVLKIHRKSFTPVAKLL